MNRLRALNLVIGLIDVELQRAALDANLHEKYNATYSAAVRASKLKRELQEAKLILLEMRGDTNSGGSA
jgi:hypothetical protein